MTRQGGGTGQGWPPIGQSRRGWPRPAVAPALAFLGAFLLLTGCSGAGIGAALGSLGTAGASFAASATGEDIRNAAEWRAGHRLIVNNVTTSMLTRARALETTDWDAAMKIYEKVLVFSEDQQPKILLERLAERYRRVKERREAVVPEAKVVGEGG